MTRCCAASPQSATPHWAGKTAGDAGFARAISLVCVLAALIAAPARAPAGEPRPQTPPPSADASAPWGRMESSPSKIWGRVTEVPDAKSLVVVTQELERLMVRLLGVEPPEPPRIRKRDGKAVPGQPFVEETARYLQDLVQHKQVRLETFGKDRSGRILAVVWLGEINVNLALIKEGLAWVAPSIRVTKVRVELEVAERQAQVGKYGLWALPDPEPPWKYRKRQRLPTE